MAAWQAEALPYHSSFSAGIKDAQMKYTRGLELDSTMHSLSR